MCIETQQVTSQLGANHRRFWLFLAGWLTVLPACVAQGSKPGEPESPTARKGATAMQTPPAAGAPSVIVPMANSMAIRRAGGDYEIEIRSPAGFAPRAFDPVLRIGRAEFHKHRQSSTAGDYGVVFTVPAAEFDALADGSSIGITYGPSDRTLRTFGNLDKGAAR